MKKTLSRLLGAGLLMALGLGATAVSCGGEPGEKGDPGETGTPGEKGEKGDPGAGGEAAVSLLLPSTVYAGRTALIQISGVGTHFADGSRVDFGDAALKVRSVQAGSSANLRVLVEVGADAQMGPHDVMVMSPQAPTGGTGGDEEHVMLKGGLQITPSLIAELAMGAMPAKVPQGGLVEIAMRNVDDRDNPFTTGFGQTPQLVLGPVPVGNPMVTTVRYSYLGLVDALAPAGGLRVGLAQKDRQGQPLGFASDAADKNAPQVTARMPTALTSGMAKSGELLAAAPAGTRTTNLYKLTTAVDNQAVHLAFSGLGPALSLPYMPPRGVGLIGSFAPASGQFRDGRSFESSETPGTMPGTVAARNALLLLPKAGDYYFAVYASDLSGSMNHGYTLTGRWATATSIGSLKEPMPDDSPAMPMASIMLLDKPYFATDGAADKDYDEDFIRFKAGKTGRVYASLTTTPGISLGLGLRGADCTTGTIVAPSRYSSSGNVLNEADVVEGTTYCVRIAGNSQPAPYQFVITPPLN